MHGDLQASRGSPPRRLGVLAHGHSTALRWIGLYKKADKHDRRRLNQAVFKRLWVFDDGIAAYEFTDGLKILFDRSPVVVPVPPRELGAAQGQPEAFANRTTSNPDHCFDRGLNVVHLVEVAGIEPASSGFSMGLLRAQPAVDCRGHRRCRRQRCPVSD